MNPRLVFDDLFAYAQQSLGWVRVFDGGTEEEAIALVVEPRDNPGQSAVNAAEGLVSDLERVFGGLGRMRMLVAFVDDPRGEGWTELLEDGGRVEFERRSIEYVEALVGEAATTRELAEPTCTGLGGEGHALLALLQPPELPRNPIDDLAIVAIADLAWPHNPARCRWRNRFERLEGLYPGSRHHQAAVGAHWFLTLTEPELADCGYHEGDWKVIVDASVRVLRALEPGATLDDAAAAVEEMLGESIEAEWCHSLFVDPIVWNPDVNSVVNGQHRACALRASGAPLCVVDADGGYVSDPVAGDPRRRAAAEIASYWARRAAG